MTKKEIAPRIMSRVIISAVELLVSGTIRNGNASNALEAAGVLIIDGNTGEERRSEPKPSGETDDDEGRPLVEEGPEPQLETVPTDDPEERRLEELKKGAILGW